MQRLISYYFDAMVNRATAKALNAKGISVIMAVDVGMTAKKDPEHLQYAHEHQRVLVTLDGEFAGLTAKRQDHSGLICWTVDEQNPGRMIKVLETFAKTHTPEQVAGNVFYLK